MCVNKYINLKRLHSKTLLEFRVRSVSMAEFVAHGLTDFVLSLVVLMIRGGRLWWRCWYEKAISSYLLFFK